MSDAYGARIRAPEGDRRLTAIYSRFVAFLLLAAGLARACLILGINPAGLGYFDLSVAWRAGAVTLLFVDLFAAVGMWIGATWGPVIWGVAIVVEVAMYTVFADLFGAYPLRVVLHGLLFAAFVVFALLDWRRTLTD